MSGVHTKLFLNVVKCKAKVGMVIYTCNPNSGQDKVGGFLPVTGIAWPTK